MHSTLAQLDKDLIWHPFTPMRDWCAPEHEPLVIVKGQGVTLWDEQGRAYLDGNSSIWTNIHGHSHPHIVRAIQDQAAQLAHSSFLGFTNRPAIELAEKLVGLFPSDTLSRVFYSDNGSTAIECAMKMALQFWQLQGQPERRRFIAFEGAYHGDTLGAASLGGIGAFHSRFAGLGVPVTHVRSMADLDQQHPSDITAIVIEPIIQGAAGFRLWPQGLLHELRHWCDQHGVLLILDEVMTGFGRTGKMFACEHESVVPDFICLAKGLTGGTMPLAATLTTERIFSAFLGSVEEMKTFYYGHSYCGNPLGCTAALASLQLFETEQTLAALQPKIALMNERLLELKQRHPRHLGEIRQCGFIAGLDLLENAAQGLAFPPSALVGAKVCLAARAHGLLTRPIRDTLVLMPPLSTTAEELRRMIAAIDAALDDCSL